MALEQAEASYPQKHCGDNDGSTEDIAAPLWHHSFRRGVSVGRLSENTFDDGLRTVPSRLAIG